MKVSDAMIKRHSCRAFLPRQADQETIKRILKCASRSPSGGNTQPWRVVVVSGQTKLQIEQELEAQFRAGNRGEPDYQYYPLKWTEPYKPAYALQRISGFHRIRHYGLLANAARVENLVRARELLAAPMSPLIAVPVHASEQAAQDTPGENARPCPCCGAPMVIIEVFTRGHAPRAPPSAMGQAA